jgi:hypothetical protein
VHKREVSYQVNAISRTRLFHIWPAPEHLASVSVSGMKLDSRRHNVHMNICKWMATLDRQHAKRKPGDSSAAWITRNYHCALPH